MIQRAPRPTHDFYILSNEIANDSRLSPEALGVLVYLLTKPDDWVIHKSHLQKHFGCGRQRMDRIFDDLKRVGYMYESEEERKDGRFQNKVWMITEIPCISTTPAVGEKPQRKTHQREMCNYKELTIQRTEDTNNYMGEFNRFWISFPTKKNKKGAEKAFMKVAKEAHPLLIDFVDMLIKDIEMRKNLGQLGFNKMHPATYLNGERWHDDYPEPDNKTDFSNHSDFVNRHTDTSWAE